MAKVKNASVFFDCVCLMLVQTFLMSEKVIVNLRAVKCLVVFLLMKKT